WTRYACYLDLSSIRARLKLAECVVDHVFKDNWQGEERGFVCDEHDDAVIGDYERRPGRPAIGLQGTPPDFFLFPVDFPAVVPPNKCKDKALLPLSWRIVMAKLNLNHVSARSDL